MKQDISPVLVGVTIDSDNMHSIIACVNASLTLFLSVSTQPMKKGVFDKLFL
jgi:hypothetical protein